MSMFEWNRLQVQLGRRYEAQMERGSDAEREIVVVTQKWPIDHELLHSVYMDMVHRVGKANFYTVHDLLLQRIEEVIDIERIGWMMSDFSKFKRDSRGVFVYRKRPRRGPSGSAKAGEGRRFGHSSLQQVYHQKYKKFYAPYRISTQKVIMSPELKYLQNFCGEGTLLKGLRGFLRRYTGLYLTLFAPSVLTGNYLPEVLVQWLLRHTLTRLVEFDDLFFLELQHKHPRDFPRAMLAEIWNDRRARSSIGLFPGCAPQPLRTYEEPKDPQGPYSKKVYIGARDKEFIEARIGMRKSTRSGGWMSLPELPRNYFRSASQEDGARERAERAKEVVEWRESKRKARVRQWEDWKKGLRKIEEGKAVQEEIWKKQRERKKQEYYRREAEKEARGKAEHKGPRESRGPCGLDVETGSSGAREADERGHWERLQSSFGHARDKRVHLAEMNELSEFVKNHLNIFFFRQNEEFLSKHSLEIAKIKNELSLMENQCPYFMDFFQEIYDMDNIHFYFNETEHN